MNTENMNTEKIEDLNILMRQRREKLEELRESNIEPYGQKNRSYPLCW